MIQDVLTGPRLVLRFLEARDDGQFWRLRSDPVVLQWLDRQPWESVDRAREERLKLAAGIETGKWAFWGVSESPTGPLWGTVCLWNFTPDRRAAEVGFELFPGRQGRGFATEAVGLVLDWAWRQLPLEHVAALTHQGNRAARRVLERLGFVPGAVPLDWELTEAETGTQQYYRLDRPNLRPVATDQR